MKLLHVGCGPNTKSSTTPGFSEAGWEEVRLDIDEKVKPDIVGTMTDMHRIPTASMDAIFSSHNIEHLYPHEVGQALQEFYRVLNENGFVMLTCPDLQSVCKLIAEDKLLEPAYQSPAGPIAPIDMLYGFRPAIASGNVYMSHRTGFTEKVLVSTFKYFGFKSIISARREECYDLFCIASKTKLSEDELRSLAKDHFP